MKLRCSLNKRLPEWITQDVSVLECERESKRGGKNAPVPAKDTGTGN